MADLPSPVDFDLRRELGLPGGEQDPLLVSRRVWAGFLGLLTAILADPGVQQTLVALLPTVVPVPYVPVATAVVSALLALLSKQQDPRPVRGSDA